jgi:lipid A 4'-phosphatase
MHARPPSDPRRAHRNISLTVWAVLALAVATQCLWPRLDLVITQTFFYVPGRGFIYAHEPWVHAVYLLTPWIGRLILVGCIVIELIARLRPQRLSPLVRRTALGLLLSAALGSGVFIDNALKPEWSRPRPVQTVDFGGTQRYASILQPCPQCERGNSFASGHAAVGFSLMAFGMFAGPRWRRRWLLASVAVGGLIGWVRMAQGGHYASDVVFAFFAVWISCEIVRWWMSPGDNPGTER